jgi:hypothetical protein
MEWRSIKNPSIASTAAKKYNVNHNTLQNRIKGKTQSLLTNGGKNKMLSPIEFDVVTIYIRKQAYAGFPCTWHMIQGTVSWIRAQNNLPPPSLAWSKNFMSKKGPIRKAGFHRIK